MQGTIGADGRLDPAPAAPTRRVVSASTAARVSRALQAVVQVGTGKQWSLPGYPVAAKTGTGRMPSPDKVDAKDAYVWPDGTYHHVTTFAGYLPADRPQVSITVMLFDTAQGLTGSTSAGPVFSDLSRLAIRELSIADHDRRRVGGRRRPGALRSGGVHRRGHRPGAAARSQRRGLHQFPLPVDHHCSLRSDVASGLRTAAVARRAWIHTRATEATGRRRVTAAAGPPRP